MASRNAFITILGRPNVGKSSLLNKLVGEKIAAVSPKPQTTRTKITGVLTQDEIQYVFIDTPGMHRPKTKLSEHMIKAINDSVTDMDIAMLVVDCTKPVSDAERTLAATFRKNTKAILVINKIDLLENKDELIKIIADYSNLYDFSAVVPISAVFDDGIDILLRELSKLSVEGPHFFPDDIFTDQPEKVIAAEIIREQLMRSLSEEVPHGVAVSIEKFSERDNRAGEGILDISANIYCERNSHKGIIIGKNGTMLKNVGAASRQELENFFRIKVNLQLWVKVKEGWRNREALIKNFGLSN